MKVVINNHQYIVELSIEKNKSLKELTTLQVGGFAQQYVAVDSEQMLNEAVSYAKENELKITVLGGGSNVLIAEDGVRGMVLHMKMRGIEESDKEGKILLTAGAGEILDEVIEHAVKKGYWGLENLSHIPGTVGAAPVQNVGAYGVEVKEIIESVRVYNTEEQKFEMLTADECCFGYRDSLFKKEVGKKYIVVAVTFVVALESGPCLTYKDLQQTFTESQKVAPSDVRNAVIAIRSKKFPDWKRVGTAGSFFKNPVIHNGKFEELSIVYPDLPSFPAGDTMVKIPLGWVLDKILNLKGEGSDTVGTYQGQALVLINKGDATSNDITAFAEGIVQKVYDTIGVDIEWEVTKIGF